MNRTVSLLVCLGLAGCQDLTAPALRERGPLLAPAFAVIGEFSIIDLGALGGNYSIPQAINDVGQVIGVAHTMEGRRGFFWQNGTMVDLGTLGGRSTQPAAFNNAGQIVGTSALAGEVANHAFLWQNGVMIDLFPNDRSVEGQAVGINTVGMVVGNRFNPAEGKTESFLWHNGAVTRLGSLGGSQTFVRAINRDGQVAGTSKTATGNHHAFVWQNGVMTDLGTLGGAESFGEAISDAGHVAGTSQTATGDYHAFVWQNGTLTDLGTLGGGYSRALDINNLGQLVGESVVVGGFVHAFLWQNGAMTDLGTRAEEESNAFAINELGQIAGSVWASEDRPERGVVWQDGTRIELPPLAGKNSSLALAINRAGQVAGYSSTDGTSAFRATLWTVVPPATPAEEVADLIAEINALIASGGLSAQQAQPLLVKLDVATKQLEKANTQAALQQLLAFVRMVEADVAAGRLSIAAGGALITGAQNAIQQLSP